MLTIFAPFDSVISILINGWPKVACSDGFLGEGACPCMVAVEAMVYFLNDVLGLVRAHATDPGLEITIFAEHAVRENILGGFDVERVRCLSGGEYLPHVKVLDDRGHPVILVVSDG